MHTDSSAIFTCMLVLSGSEWTATVLMPISLHARITRTAISPRFAMRIFLNMAVPVPAGRFYFKKRLAILDGVSVVDQRFQDPARFLSDDVLADFHRFDRRH